MFNKKLKEKNTHLARVNEELVRRLNMKEKELLRKPVGSMADLMRKSLGLAIDFSAASADNCMPKHFLAGLDEDAKKNFVIHMETIHSDQRFQAIMRYMINLFATNAIYKADPEQMKNGRVAAVAFRTLLDEFDRMHAQFLEYQKVDDRFDPLEVLAE